jgi:hypothetical protein
MYQTQKGRFNVKLENQNWIILDTTNGNQIAKRTYMWQADSLCFLLNKHDNDDLKSGKFPYNQESK